MQFFDIVLFALIAIFLVLRLKNVLGSRDGHDGSGYDDMFKRDQNRERLDEQDNDNVIDMPGSRAPMDIPEPAPVEAEPEEELPEGPLGEGIRAIREYDASFDMNEFLGGSRMAFEMILNAYADGDTKMLKNLLSPEVYSGFEHAIKQREAEGQTLQETLVGISKAEMVEAYMDGRDAHVTVKFVSEQISALMDSDGKVIEGDPSAVTDATDFWTFARSTKSRNPNWTLVGTGSLD
ncbi:Tim44/TimA family putative adaptor protein [Magnetovibrio sp. PR-2]|uniref:Tim44/TimA family putative adaptor protein n=1 Tax=Magnetovibrio sp. PR-2 TaxID=3120356 RepID=UPI002FCE1814